MAGQGVFEMEGFELGKPVLICRWRLANKHLPLENRHLRALGARRVEGKPIKKPLLAWAKQHIEWTLEQGAFEYPDGTLMLIVDDDGRAAMTVGPYEPLADVSLMSLRHRAEKAQYECRETSVAPETLWIARKNQLVWDPGVDAEPSGAASLVSQLARTMGIDVVRYEGLLDGLATGAVSYDEAFLVSDEHGVVPADDATGRHGRGMSQGYQRLLSKS